VNRRVTTHVHLEQASRMTGMPSSWPGLAGLTSEEAWSNWLGSWVFLATDPVPPSPLELGPNHTCSRLDGVGVLPASWPSSGEWVGRLGPVAAVLPRPSRPGRLTLAHFLPLVLCRLALSQIVAPFLR
jgi:hypothetical protein